jgi:lipoprotein NlpI
MAKFTQGDVEGSITDFDLVVSSAPQRAPYLWQRGLSLYYAERLREGSEQFRKDVAVNPNDTEEAVWAFLCEARDPGIGFEKARDNLLKVGKDPRGYMREAYALFAGTGDEERLRATADDGGAAEDFYSWLYVALYREAKGDAAGAKTAMLNAVATPYGSRSGDYMAALAEVHAKRRGWS